MDNSFFAMIARMRHIQRWGLMRNSQPENLSEHTLEVALLTHALCEIENRRLGGSIDVGAAVLCALYHDAAEIITGDMPTPVKYHSAQLQNAYKEVEAGANRQLLAMLPQDLRHGYSAPMLCGDDAILRLVKAADKLSALIKCTQEVNSGNQEFAAAAASTRTALTAMHLPAADIFIAEFLPAYSSTLDQLLAPPAQDGAQL